MEQDERWNQFAASGKVTDYLRYRESVNYSGNGQSSDSTSYSYRSTSGAFAETSANSNSSMGNFGRYE